ncbi:hypothetical protein LOZ12_000314 [Ophidiomyces ophidiicola]|uniref:Uncharacterized protein n=1 Tax=Ophidiomyces ophidiicola TaxID=1387563 RepID=A0ACB8V4H5_9EURO|nr:uncharacterized protein LOZ57_000767 [Ophidiomyces ophidiicola]KAI1917989.1 hypothetical protein LOZ61_000104 [Ophidiomyces ophidiicola]KAI1931548.1 hypothetical protein LOZ60_000079 [Ophidiomyces ophidiicola]KAI1944750.1 hypothetical protein LOZ62_004028 [Ophidiomyces ophidiicola]KAI1952688.1 hypothetical protein LOZ57_000767 [Ophidiomyces ophidiicola]KAI1969119.1 hypothetical protein LOZ59_000146 [Ophidiomyces ophidiicola]
MANQIFTDLGDSPPVYRIDLSLPPSERYVELATIYRNKLRSLTGLFDELISSLRPGISLIWVQRAARLFLRRLYTNEETEEIKGICKATGIDLYLLVSLNVLLDLLMGCTSGAALSKDDGDIDARMLHFRTLDWNMDGLRELIVQLEFVRGPDTENVLATSITYVGFVGVLTGTRKGLSVSLNFRPNHDMSTAWANMRFYGNHILVLLGIRRSISSLLRQCLLPSESPEWKLGAKSPEPKDISLDVISAVVPQIPTTAAYLIFCDGRSAVTMEKDHRSAVVQASNTFIVTTNSDVDTMPSLTKNHSGLLDDKTMMLDIIEDSNYRKACMQAHWDRKIEKWNHARNAQPNDRQQSPAVVTTPEVLEKTSSRGKESPVSTEAEGVSDKSVTPVCVTATPVELIQWTTTYPTTNQMTHFATIMDPTFGKIFWLKRYPVPLGINTNL